MAARPRWVLATGNSGKLEEFRRLLAPCALELVAMRELGIDSPAETGLTFVENALLKARHASRRAALPAIADDSGLAVDALNGAPGLRSARYAGPQATDRQNVERLLGELREVAQPRRGAAFICVIVALRSPDDPDPVVATGRWHGTITRAARGSNGFGYDPVFEVPGTAKTAAELSAVEKSALSHRAQAAAALLAQWPRLHSPGT